MGTKLYVANLPHAPNALALRAHFSACGVVSDIQISPDRNAGRGRGAALVRMKSVAGAERALAELNGSTFAGQLLLVEAAPDDVAERRGGAVHRDEDGDDRPGARIAVQYRERANMAYELDCSGITIVIRVFFPNATDQWRVVVGAGRAADAPSIAAAAASRLEAFRGAAHACSEHVGFAKLERPDWDAVEKAMLAVRAL